MPFMQLDTISQSEPVPGFVGRFIHSENITIADWEIKAGSVLSEHAHLHEQIAYILEGSLELTLEGETQILTPGMIAIIPSNAPHEGKALTDCHLVDIFYPVREDLRQMPEKK
jgi:quercetin dioxygenase-like cupin family protein